jgi:hypothetical protein
MTRTRAIGLMALSLFASSVLSPELYGTFFFLPDDDLATRWSDGYARRSEFTGSPAPYRSDTTSGTPPGSRPRSSAG